jgi:hypothetical protein
MLIASRESHHVIKFRVALADGVLQRSVHKTLAAALGFDMSHIAQTVRGSGAIDALDALKSPRVIIGKS